MKRGDVRVRTARRLALLSVVLPWTLGCPPAGAQPSQRRGADVVVSVVGTNDFHGRLEALPVFAGYLRNLRRARRDGGVLLVDAGDMFQGTLESNLGEGAAVVRAYNALGYAAAAIGNHEFDFGPVGEAATPQRPEDDPRGALRARAREARFPFLAANVLDRATGQRVAWDNVRASTIVTAGGVRVGVVGVTTEETLRTTIAANVGDLRIAPLVETVRAEAARLRADGATAIVVAAHAGGRCHRFDRPEDLSSCDAREEIFEVARALRPGEVDVIVAGHTHQRVAHVVNGIAVIESHASGRAFGRVDLTIERATGRVRSARVFPPRDLCPGRAEPCAPGSYEGAPVVADDAIARLLRPDFERARELREQRLGVRVETRVRRSYDEESALGNLFTDLMRAARPGADVAITNGGGLRADLPVGELTYGQVFEAMPFDNHFAMVQLTGAELARLFRRNLQSTGGILSVSGVRVAARCDGRRLVVTLSREDGRPVRDDETLRVATSDFLATGGDDVLSGAARRPGAVELDETGAPIRDAMADVLRHRGGSLRVEALLPPGQRRIAYDGHRPVRCGR